MSTSEPHKNPKVKISVTSGRLDKKIISTQLQGLFLIALEQYAADRALRNTQAVAEILEKELFREGYLPAWWYERGKGVV